MIIPTVALVAIAAIPYIDRSPLGVGILGTSTKGRKIIGFSTVYTTVVSDRHGPADAFIDDEGTVFGSGRWLVQEFGAPEFVTAQVLPSIIILGAIAVLMGMVAADLQSNPARNDHRPLHRLCRHLVMLTVFGTSFRGEGQELTWVWDLPLEHH